MIDLEKLVQDSLKGMFESGKFVEIIDKHTEALVNSAVRDALSTYSEFGKQLSASLAESLRVDVGGIGLPGYNQIVLNIIRQKLTHVLDTAGREKIESDLTELLATTAPAEIKLSKLVENFTEWARGDNGLEDWEECDVTIHYEISEHGSHHLYLDPAENVQKYSCRFNLHMYKDGKILSTRIAGKDTEKVILIGSLYGFERDLFHMHVAKTLVVFDETEFDNHIYSKHS